MFVSGGGKCAKDTGFSDVYNLTPCCELFSNPKLLCRMFRLMQEIKKPNSNVKKPPNKLDRAPSAFHIQVNISIINRTEKLKRYNSSIIFNSGIRIESDGRT